MSLTLLPYDGADLSLLLRAGIKASSTTLRQLNHDRMQDLVHRDGIDLATAVLYARTKREHPATTREIDAFYQEGGKEIALQNVGFVYVPNLAFFADPGSQAVGNAICQAAERFGCSAYVAATSATLSLEANARIVLEQLAAVKEESIIVASVSKGSADVKMALREPDSEAVFSRVVGWIDALGLSDGSPVVNALESNRELERRLERWFSRRGLSYVREVLAATKQLAYGPGNPLHGPLKVPSHITRLNVVGFPTSRHFRFRGWRELHSAIASYGPNDGYGLLRDMVMRPGMVYPIWGTDHYFEAHLNVERLATALLSFLAPRLGKPCPPTAKSNGHSLPPIAPVERQTTQEGPPERIGKPPRSTHASDLDWERIRHARMRDEGFPVGRYLQPPPMLFTRDGHNLFLGDMYRGHAAFLVAGGPSLATCDLQQLQQRGIVTCGMNNSAAVFRPNLWLCVDDPGNFVDAIWKDAGILKFVPLCHMEKRFMERNESGELIPSEATVGDMPTVFGYRRNEHFREEQWLYEDTFNWGNHSDKVDSVGNKGSRSVMYVALRLLFYLGIRRLYLLGCDFRMEHGAQNYAFPQDRSVSSVRGNNESYYVLNQRLARLQPYFEREGFEIFNCTPNSGLTVFPYVSFDNAIQEATAHLPSQVDTSGMYDRQQRERDAKKQEKDAKLVSREGAPTVATEPVPIPNLTIIAAVNHHTLQRLALTWPTWLRFRPEITAMPVIIVHDHTIEPHGSRAEFLHDLPNVRFVSTSGEDSADQLEKTVLQMLVSEVQTPWYLHIDPNVLATESDAWLDIDWFQPDRGGRRPVLIGKSQKFTKPAHILDDLDRWGDRTDGLSDKPPLAVSHDAHADRVHFSGIADWCFLGDTAWTREVAPYGSNGLPCTSLALYLSYCATRRKDRILRADLSHYGWSHIVGSERRLGYRCAEALRENEAIAAGALPQ